MIVKRALKTTSTATKKLFARKSAVLQITKAEMENPEEMQAVFITICFVMGRRIAKTEMMKETKFAIQRSTVLAQVYRRKLNSRFRFNDVCI